MTPDEFALRNGFDTYSIMISQSVSIQNKDKSETYLVPTINGWLTWTSNLKFLGFFNIESEG